MEVVFWALVVFFAICYFSTQSELNAKEAARNARRLARLGPDERRKEERQKLYGGLFFVTILVVDVFIILWIAS